MIGISGGPDSVALTRILHILQKNYRLSLALVHINYGLRGKDSDKDEKFVTALSGKIGLPLRVYKYSAAAKSEEALRDFRYNIFEKVRQEKGFKKVAVAHTKDDQVETILLNLLRGTGLKGLGGMRPQRGRIIRPLLGFERGELLAFLKDIDQPYRTDKTNREIIYLRNRIRNKLLPLLEKEFNPKVKDNIFNVGENLRFDWQLVEETGNKAYNRYIKKSKSKRVLEIKSARRISAGLLRYLFRRTMRELLGKEEISLQNFKEFDKIVKSEKPKKSILRIKNVVIIKEANEIVFKKAE